VCTLALAYFSHSVKPASTGSVLERAAVPAAVPASGAAAIPSTTVPAPAPAAAVPPATPASGAAQIPTK